MSHPNQPMDEQEQPGRGRSSRSAKGTGADPAADEERGQEWERGREDAARRARHHRRGHRKERILHTRISRQLADHIRVMAEDLRVPVSNLVRNVLEEAFDVMEEVTDDVGDLLGEAIHRAERAARRMDRHRESRRETEADGAPSAPEQPAPGATGGAVSLAQAFPDVLAWQRVVLNQPRRCALTGEELAAGSGAYLGFPAGGGPPIAISEWSFFAGTSAA